MRVLALLWAAATAAVAAPRIFPAPRETQPAPGAFLLDGSAVIAVPPGASATDRSLAAFLSAELTDRFQLPLRTVPMESLAAGQRAVVIGSVAGAWMRRTVEQSGLNVPGAEGYVMEIGPSRILIAGRDDAGAFYGFQSLRQLLGPAGTRIAGQRIRDWPASPFRGIKMYLPGRDHIAFFKRFVRDFMAQYKFNRLILELNAGMRLDRHPEVNAGWLELSRDLFATRRERPIGPHREGQDSVHHDAADGGILEKSEVAGLADWARLHHIEVIPELPTLTHSYYLLARHHELAELPDAEWPDTYCPSLAATYRLVFDVLDEYIDVLHPAMVHVGHDEWGIPWGVCPRCRDKDPRQLFADDLNRIYAHLKSKGIRTAIWGDHLIEPLRGVRLKEHTSKAGATYQVPGALSPEQILARIPKDILVFNWFWDDALPGQGVANDRRLSDWGFQQIYGNMTPGVPNYPARSRAKGVIGGAPSSWAATTPENFGKDLLDQFLGCAAMLWSRESLPPPALLAVLERESPRIADTFRGTVQWSSLREPVVPLPLPSAPADPAMPRIPPGRVQTGRYVFDVAAPLSSASAPTIAIGRDAASLVFLHASAARGQSRMAYNLPHDFDDTADLVGWYEVVYEDGFVLTLPLRTEVNILGWQRRPASAAYPYQATAIHLGNATFYAWEWTNPRPGKVIREVRLRQTTGFRRLDGTTASNSVILAGISYVPKRIASAPRVQRP